MRVSSRTSSVTACTPRQAAAARSAGCEASGTLACPPSSAVAMTAAAGGLEAKSVVVISSVSFDTSMSSISPSASTAPSSPHASAASVSDAPSEARARSTSRYCCAKAASCSALVGCTSTGCRNRKARLPTAALRNQPSAEHEHSLDSSEAVAVAAAR